MSEEKAPTETQVAVANEEPKAVAVSNADAMAEEFFDPSDTMSDFQQGDFLVPYLRILQALSKELQKGHQKYIKGAEAGQIINSATKNRWDGEKGFYIIPISFSHRYQAWRPNNGGVADDYGNDDAVYKISPPNEKGKHINSDGNEVTDANQYFVFIVDPETGQYEMGVVSMSGSQARKARQWNSIITNRKVNVKGKMVTAPMFFYAYKVTTVAESNDQGSWYGWSISSDEGFAVSTLPNGRDILAEGKSTRERIQAGEIKTQVEDTEDHFTSTEDEKVF